MDAADRARKNILEFRNVREDIIGETAVESYYDFLTKKLEIKNLPIIVCNTLEKRTSFVETYKDKFFLVFDNYIIELFHQLNKYMLQDDIAENVESFFYKIASEECYIRLRYEPAIYFAGQYLNSLEKTLFEANLKDMLDPVPNYLFVQQAFLVAHELSHFWTRVSFRSQKKYINSKKNALFNIYEYAKKNHSEVSDSLLAGIRTENIFEECLCDSVGLVQAIDIGTKLKNITVADCSIACTVALMNLCILSTMSLLVEKASNFSYEEILNKYNLRILQLKSYTSRYLREYFSINDKKEYEDTIEDITHEWFNKIVNPILKLGLKNVNKFNSDLRSIPKDELIEIKSVLKQIYQS